MGANVSAPKAIVRAIYVSAIAALLLNVALTSALPKAADGGIDAEQYGAIAFGGPGDSFLVNAAPRLLDTALGSAAAKLLMFIAIVAQFWPFWPPFGETTFGTGADAVTVFHQNNFNFTGPLILATAAFFWLYWGLSARRWFTGPKVQGTREEQLAIERELEAAAAGKAAVPTPGGIVPEPT